MVRHNEELPALVIEDSNGPGLLPWVFRMRKDNAFLDTECWQD